MSNFLTREQQIALMEGVEKRFKEYEERWKPSIASLVRTGRLPDGSKPKKVTLKIDRSSFLEEKDK